jgi:hypothetical protein
MAPAFIDLRPQLNQRKVTQVGQELCSPGLAVRSFSRAEYFANGRTRRLDELDAPTMDSPDPTKRQGLGSHHSEIGLSH